MTAKQLIDQLSKLPQDAQVSIAFKGIPTIHGATEELRPVNSVRTLTGRVLLQGE